MDFGLAFTYVFEDEAWIKKLAIAGVILLGTLILSPLVIPFFVGMFILTGWLVEITRRVIQGHPEPLADWDDLGGYLTLGLKAFVVNFVFALPIIVVSAPLGVLSAVLDSSSGAQTVIALLSACLGCIGFLYGILLALAIPAAMGQLAVTDEIGPALNPGKVLALVRAAPGAYIIAALGTIVAGFLGSLGLILCVVGVFFTYAYTIPVAGHLYGQAHKLGSAGLAGAGA